MSFTMFGVIIPKEDTRKILGIISRPQSFVPILRQTLLVCAKDFGLKVDWVVTNSDNNRLLKELQDREDGKLVISGVKVKSIGCWDTVGSLGIPSIRVPFFGELSIARGENKTYLYRFLPTWYFLAPDNSSSFHNVELSDEVENAFHALALDEHRGPFTPTLWKKSPFSPTNLKQVWFPGVHTNIGGGYDDQEIADITLAWMIQQHLPFLEFSKGYLKSIIKNHEDYTREWAAGLIYDSATGMMRVFSGSYRTPGGYADSTEGVEMEEFIHKSVRIRTKMIEGWECRALKGWVWKEDEGLWEKDGKTPSFAIH